MTLLRIPTPSADPNRSAYKKPASHPDRQRTRRAIRSAIVLAAGPESPPGTYLRIRPHPPPCASTSSPVEQLCSARLRRSPRSAATNLVGRTGHLHARRRERRLFRSAATARIAECHPVGHPCPGYAITLPTPPRSRLRTRLQLLHQLLADVEDLAILVTSRPVILDRSGPEQKTLPPPPDHGADSRSRPIAFQTGQQFSRNQHRARARCAAPGDSMVRIVIFPRGRM